MQQTVPVPERLTREEVIGQLRQELMRLTDTENCMCKVAAERGLFCGGFRQFTDQQLRDRYWWIVRKQPDISRADLERIANDWQLTQQEVQLLPIACDVQTQVHDTCRGWHDFTNEDLEQYFRQLTGRDVRVA